MFFDQHCTFFKWPSVEKKKQEISICHLFKKNGQCVPVILKRLKAFLPFSFALEWAGKVAY